MTFRPFQAALALLVFTSVTGAASIQFDFSTQSGAYTGTESPAHDLNLLGSGDDQWNGIHGLTGAISSGVQSGGQPEETQASGNDTLSFVFTDGTAAPGIEIDFGAFFRVNLTGSGNPAGQIDWDEFETFIESFAYSASQTIYDTALGEDLFFHPTNEAGGAAVAVRVSGLAAGRYEVLPIAFNDNTDAARLRTYNIRIGVNIDELADDAPEVLSNITGVTTWTQGKNYARTLVNISGPNDWITVFSTGGGSNNAVFNGLQIVQIIPEPATLGLIGLGTVALLRRRR